MTLGICPRGQGKSPEFKTLPLKGIEKYKWFYESQLAEILEDYHKGKITKSVASEAIASACAGKSNYQLFHIVDVWRDGEPIDRRLFRSDATLKKLLSEAKRQGWALLYRGLYAIPGKVFSEYKETYAKANRLEVFRLNKLTPLAQYVLIDIDGGTFEDLKRVVSYLHKLGVYPEVWESASGEGNYHIYINLVGMVERWKTKTEEGEEQEHVRYYLPYTSDYRVKLVVDALKELFKHLGVSYDSISATRAVWMEGFPNPEKGGKASRKIWEGKHHRLDSLTKKLQPFWERPVRERARKEYFSFLSTKRSPSKATGSLEIYEESHSNPIDFLQANVSSAFRMLDRGYTWAEIEGELRAGWGGDDRAFDRAFSGFRKFVETTYRPLQRAKNKAKPKDRRKHTHYWEHVQRIHEVLAEDGVDSSLNHIHRRTGIAKGTLSYIFRIVSKEQILTNPEEAQKLLKEYQKGGDRMTEDQKNTARERGRERWKRYVDQFLREAVKKKRKSLKDNKKAASQEQEEWFSSLRGVQIGPNSITQHPLGAERKGGDGDVSPSERGEGIRIVDEVESLLSLVNLSDSDEERKALRKRLLRWLFRALRRSMRGERETYNLSRFSGLGEKFIEALSAVLRRMGHEVKNEEKVIGVELDVEECKETFEMVEVVDVEVNVRDIVPLPDSEDEKVHMTKETFLNVKEVKGGGEALEEGLAGEGKVFIGKNEAIAYLESQNGKYGLGDRVKLWVRAPNKILVPYEFEKVRKKVFWGWEVSGEVETWELKRIHWEEGML